MKHIFVHIGYPKTGSSALQTTFLASRRLLREKGYFFPNVPSGLCNVFTAYFHHRPGTLFPYCDMQLSPRGVQRKVEKDFDRFTRQMEESTLDTAIISSESLIGLEEDAVERARDWLLAKATNVTIVCYVRDPISYASSLIQERVKQGETLSQSAAQAPTGNFSVWIPRWVRAFGKDRVVVRAASRSQIVDGDVVADFAAAIGYTGTLDRSSEYINRSLSQPSVLLLDALNSLGGDVNSKTPEFCGLWNIPGRKFTLPVAMLEKISISAKRETDYLQLEWGITFADHGTLEEPGDAFDEAALKFIAGYMKRLHLGATKE